MSERPRLNMDCVLVGDYLDVGVIPAGWTAPIGRSDRDVALGGEAREFRVLLQDHRVVTVQGHGLRFVPNASNPTDNGSYAILHRDGEHETTVALFPVREVAGIFSGEVGTSAT